MGMRGNYKVRTNAQGISSFHVPAEIADVLPEDQRFNVELTEEGILYRPAPEEAPKPELPAWIKA